MNKCKVCGAEIDFFSLNAIDLWRVDKMAEGTIVRTKEASFCSNECADKHEQDKVKPHTSGTFP